MVLGVSLTVLVLIAAAMLVGATTQALTGVGLGLVGAPVMMLLVPELMPGLMLWAATLLPMLQLVRDWPYVDWRGLAYALPARVPGTAIGVWFVVVFTDQQLGVAVGLFVLGAVLLTWQVIVVPITRTTLIGAGVVSGVAGTATSIGGPPLALLYQHRRTEQVRATLAVYFLAGAVLSLVGLGIGGALETRQLLLALAMLPMMLGGLGLAGWIRGRVPAAVVRAVMLSVCATSATVLLVRSLLA